MLARKYVKLLFFVLLSAVCLQTSKVWAAGECPNTENPLFVREGIGCGVSPFYYTLSWGTGCESTGACPLNDDGCCCENNPSGDYVFHDDFSLCSEYPPPYDYIEIGFYNDIYSAMIYACHNYPIGGVVETGVEWYFFWNVPIEKPLQVVDGEYEIISNSTQTDPVYDIDQQDVLMELEGTIGSFSAHFDCDCTDCDFGPVRINGYEGSEGYEPLMWVNCLCGTPGKFCCSQKISISCDNGAAFYKATLTTSGDELAIVSKPGQNGFVKTDNFDGWSCCDDVSSVINIQPIRYTGEDENAKMNISLSVEFYDKGGNSLGAGSAAVTVQVAELIDMTKLGNGGL